MIEHELSAFTLRFQPILKSEEYRNLKQEEISMIEHIPFVLTYDENLTFIIPLNYKNRLSNVAPVLTALPHQVIFIDFLETQKDVDEFAQMYDPITSFLKQKTSCKISYSLYYLQGLDISGYTHDDVVLNESNNGNVKDAIEELIHNHHAPVIEKNDTRLSHLLETIDTYSYEYDLESQSFIKTNCDALRYLWKKPMLTVADFLMLKGLDQIQQRPLEDFEEDDEVWPLYCKHKEAWDDLCEILSNDAKQEDDLATFTKEKEAKQTLHYILPHFLQGSVEKILNNLKEHQFIDAYIMKNEYSDAFEVTIEEHYDHQEQFTQLFSFVEALMDEKGLSITYDGPQHVYIKRNSLHVRHVAIQSSEVMMLLKKLNEKHFFIQFSCHDDVVRLVYRSPSIKELLIDRQAIIMRHVEHICLTQTSLDDYAVLDNECCVMLISGFKVINIIYENDRNHLINTLDFEGVYFIIIGDTNEVINDHMRKVGWNNL